uniref:Peptidase S1 domain-containing protein n=1 Tax=Ciona savignyi TaxID=51511 RepID=H2YDK5_CIOSA
MEYIVFIFILVVATVSLTDCQIYECGTTPAVNARRTRIFGGTAAAYGSIPWQINLLENGRKKCGATLLTPKWVLTARHCIVPRLISTNSRTAYTAIAGDHDVTVQDTHEQLRYVIREISHPDYEAATLANDIVLLEMDIPFELNQYIIPACLPKFDESPYPYTMCQVSGWGYESPVRRPDSLRKLDMPVLHQKACEIIHHPLQGTANRITSKVLCAGHLAGSRDTCQGDSGGPLTCHRNGPGSPRVITGIVSWGKGCALPGFTGVYTRVSEYAQWINETIKIPTANNMDPCRFSGIKLNHRVSGNFSSPGYAQGLAKYPNSQVCSWEVDLSEVSSPTATAVISFDQFELEGPVDGSCRYDKLNIYTGSNFETLVGSYCGSRIPPQVTLSRPRNGDSRLKFKLVFQSDNTIGKRGFLVHFRVA